ncbi:hypothetical Protein YC6258_01320 [Gynuella sunshinyii YC6258]|uniref:Uncharacterized protein n=1 Tax=Gynuella sunshinyii YC6258 TaxID=1445510 RepID=A0A0C5VJ11_9GAMM|nr:hypothetical Protein YC6258_01320 [Gynuella sunshinyii YC6258]
MISDSGGFDHRFWKSRKSDQIKPEWVITLGQNMQAQWTSGRLLC